MIERKFGVARWVMGAALVGMMAAGANAADASLSKVGGGLRQVMASAAAAGKNVPVSKSSPLAKVGIWDAQDRLMVNVRITGARSLDAVSADLVRLGASVSSKVTIAGGQLMSVYIPLNKIADAAKIAGLKSIMMEHKAKHNVGKVTSEAVQVLRAEALQVRGITGKGITIGVLSDSYDTNTNSMIRAADDVASGDLPGTGNPLGHTTPLVVLEDFPGGTDEGRGMLQLIHDIAPDAKLCFATADNGQAGFASNILALADKKQACGADIVVDDVFYFAEPVFSDGIIANAVNTVAKAGVPYFSSAGNANGNGYDSDFRQVTDAAARAGIPGSNLKLDQVPKTLTAGGFHNFAATGPAAIAQPVRIFGDEIIGLQWNDPFDANGITSDYNILIFDAAGNYLPMLSGADDAVMNDEPIQFAQPTGPTDPNVASISYQIVIARSNAQPGAAKRFHYEAFQSNTVFDGFAQFLPPTISGHAAANGALGVAADYWGNVRGTESFSSVGPTAIYFDANNKRLRIAEVRKKPDIASVDGNHTTFFPVGGNIGNDPFPRFFGTSAAAPNAAAVGALVMQVAGGPGSVSPALMKSTLQASARPHAAIPAFVSAAGASRGAQVGIEVRQDGLIDRTGNAFAVSFTDTVKGSTRSLVTLQFDLTRAGQNVPLNRLVVSKTSGVSAANISLVETNFPSSTFTLNFKKGSFVGGTKANFDFIFADAVVGLNNGGNSNTFSGTKFTAVFDDGAVATGTFNNNLAKTYDILNGFGLVDADAAVAQFEAR